MEQNWQSGRSTEKVGWFHLDIRWFSLTVVTTEQLYCSPKCHHQIYTSTVTPLSLVLSKEIKVHFTLSFSEVCRLRKISFSIISMWPRSAAKRNGFLPFWKSIINFSVHYTLTEPARQPTKWAAAWGEGMARRPRWWFWSQHSGAFLGEGENNPSHFKPDPFLSCCPKLWELCISTESFLWG